MCIKFVQLLSSHTLSGINFNIFLEISLQKKAQNEFLKPTKYRGKSRDVSIFSKTINQPWPTRGPRSSPTWTFYSLWNIAILEKMPNLWKRSTFGPQCEHLAKNWPLSRFGLARSGPFIKKLSTQILTCTIVFRLIARYLRNSYFPTNFKKIIET